MGLDVFLRRSLGASVDYLGLRFGVAPVSPRFSDSYLSYSVGILSSQGYSFSFEEDVAPEFSSAATLGLALTEPVMVPGSWGPSLDGAITGLCLGLSSEEQWLASCPVLLLDRENSATRPPGP